VSRFPLPLFEGEVVLREDEPALYVKSAFGIGYNILHGRLWLTSARMVHQDFPLGRLTAYPLCRIVAAIGDSVGVAQKKFEIQGVYTSWTSYDRALSLEFDNGGLEYFIPQDVDGWAQAVSGAIPSAPALDYSQAPSLRPSLHVEPGPVGAAKAAGGRSWLTGVLVAAVVVFLCGAAACVGLTVLAALLGSHGN
jgi:hypothetical protein